MSADARCAWCGRKTDTPVRIGDGSDGLVADSSQCVDAFVAASQGLGARVKLFFGGLILGFSIMIFGAVVAPFHPTVGYLAPVGLILIGVTIIAIPAVTPQTVRLMGLRRGIALGRGLGGVMVALALFLTAMMAADKLG